jgi:uncharacterized membrane protein
MNKQKINILLFLIVILGFLLRIYHIGVISLWYDEFSTAGRAEGSFNDVLRSTLGSPFPPLYYILMHFWIDLFGISEFSLRFPSLIFSTLSIIYIFKLSKSLFDAETGLIAAFLLAVSLYSIGYAQEAKMYAMIWFFSLASFYYFYQFIKDGETENIILCTLFNILAAYTLYLGFVFVLIQNLVFFILYFDKNKISKWLIAHAAIVLSYLPWVILLIGHPVNHGGLNWILLRQDYVYFLFNLFSFTLGFSSEAMHLSALVQGYFAAFYGVLLVSVFFKSNKTNEDLKKEYLLLFWIIFPILLLTLIHFFYMPILVVRYLGLIHIPLMILLSQGLSRYSSKIKYSLLILITLLTFTFRLYPYYERNIKIYCQPEMWRSLFSQIHQEKKGNTLTMAYGQAGRYLYFHKTIKYYNEGSPIDFFADRKMMMSYIDRQKFDSVFIVYRSFPEFKGKIKGYHLEKKVRIRGIGYYFYKKI